MRRPVCRRRARVAIGHVRARLFVASRDKSDARLLPQRRNDSVKLYSRVPKNDLNSLFHERFDEGFATTDLREVLLWR